VYCASVCSVSACSRCLTSHSHLLPMDALKSVSAHQLCLSMLEGAFQGEGPTYSV